MSIRIMLVALGLGLAPMAVAEEAKPAAAAKDAAKEAAPAEDGKAKAEKKETKVHYKKSKQVDFSNQTVEGKLHRPEASLVTASEGVNDNGLLRLREDFLDKFTTFVGEEIQQ